LTGEHAVKKALDRVGGVEKGKNKLKNFKLKNGKVVHHHGNGKVSVLDRAKKGTKKGLVDTLKKHKGKAALGVAALGAGGYALHRKNKKKKEDDR